MRYGLTTYALTSSTIATAPTIVTTQSTIDADRVRQPAREAVDGVARVPVRVTRRRSHRRRGVRRPVASGISAGVVGQRPPVAWPSRSETVGARPPSAARRPRCRRSAIALVDVAHRTLRARLCSRRQRLDPAVVAGEQHVGDVPAAVLRGTRVVRVLEPAVELRGEALELAGALGERARQPARDRVEQHHRRQLAAGEDVRADRDRVGAEVRDDPLVEALEARGEQRELGLRGELLDERLVELAPLRRQRDDPCRPIVAVAPRARRRRRRRGAPCPRRRRTGRRRPGRRAAASCRGS